MPGVPSSRGCDACRKVKKKCDQGKPSCGRCTRLGIECIGSGQRRFKFQQHKVAFQADKDTTRKEEDANTLVLRKQKLKPFPTNHELIITGNLISLLRVEDVRYDLSYYGLFLKEIPKHIGSNKALDASVMALVDAFSTLHTKEVSRGALVHYGHALRALRLTLLDPRQSSSVSTMCAIYLIMVTEGWIGLPADSYASHGEAMMHMLRGLVDKKDIGDFESQLMLTLAIPVVIHSAFNPNITLEPWLSKLLARVAPPNRIVTDNGRPFQSMNLRIMSRFPDFFTNPADHYHEMVGVYEQMRLDFFRIEAHLRDYMATEASGPTPMNLRVLSRFQAAYGLLLGMAFGLNKVLRAFNPADSALIKESRVIFETAIDITRQAVRYRPIGASFAPLCLFGLWTCTRDRSQLDQVEALLEFYRPQFPIASWIAGARQVRETFETTLSTLPVLNRFSSEDSEEVERHDWRVGV